MSSCCLCFGNLFRWIFGIKPRSFDLATVEPFKGALRQNRPKDLAQCRSLHEGLLRERGDLLERSQGAFKAGRGKEAKELSEKARILTERLEVLAILLAYYEFTGRPQGVEIKEGLAYDLHGQTRRHVVNIAKAILEHHHQTANRSTPILLIVGAGKHSEGGKVVLRPIIEEFLGDYCRANAKLSYSFDNHATFTIIKQ